MEQSIRQCQTLEQIELLERNHVLADYEKELIFERKVEIIERVLQWRRENEQLGLTATLTDTWTPEERQRL